MTDLNKKIELIFRSKSGIGILYWDPYAAKLIFYGKEKTKISEWEKFIGKKVKDVEKKLARKGILPLTADGVYVHALFFNPRRKKKDIPPLRELFKEWYYGVYLQSAFEKSLELRKSTDRILKYKSCQKIIDTFAKSLTKLSGGKDYKILSKKKIRAARIVGDFPRFDFYLPIKIKPISGIKITEVSKILPDQISLKYIENIAQQIQFFAQLRNKLNKMKLVKKRYEFLSKFSELFHKQKNLPQLGEFLDEKLPRILPIDKSEFICFHEKKTEKKDFLLPKHKTGKKGYSKKKVGPRYFYNFPVLLDDEMVTLLKIISKGQLDKSDLSFVRFLVDEIEIIVGLHVAEKRRAQKIKEMEAAYEIAGLYPLLSSPQDAYRLLAEKICNRTNFDLGGFVIVEGEYFRVMEPGYGLEKFPGPLSLKINDTEMGYSVYHSRKPIYTNQIEDQSFNTRKIVKPLGLDKLIFLPLIFKDEVIGLFVAGRKPGSAKITEEDKILMTILVNQAAILIEGLKFSQDMGRQIEELKLINEISRIANSTLYLNEIVRLSLQKLRSVVDHPYLSLYIYNEFSNSLQLMGHLGFRLPDASYRLMKPGIGIVGNAAMLRMPIMVSDVDKDNRYIKMLDDVHSELAVPIIFQEKLLGVLDIQSPEVDTFRPEESGLLSTIANQLASAIANAQLHERVEETLTDAVRALVMTIDAADAYTRGHSERVTDFAVAIATELSLPKSEVEKVKKAALLHDIGKIGISELILLKKERLTNEEMDEVKLHPLLGAQMLDGVRGFEEVRSLIKAHHEGYNGDGYPYGLRGEEIPLGARIITVADVYEALTSDRPYRPAYSKSQAIEILKSEAGGHLDPKIVSVFIKVLNRKE